MTKTKLNKLVAVCLTVMTVITLFMCMPIMKASAYPSAYPVPSLTGNQREDIVNVALSQKGYKKSGGTVYGAWYDSIKGTNYVNQAWCAMFVSWCANQAGIDQNILTYRSYVPDMVSDFQSKGQWHDRNYTPSRGDIIIVNGSGHVGIVTGVSGSTVYTIEGNKTSLGSACGTDSYTIGSSYITGYGVPNYTSSSISKPSWAWISATDDRTSFSVGEEIHFWMSADETNGDITHYLVGINKGDERIITEKCNGDYYVSFDEPGDYSVYVSAYNSAGWADSNIIYFSIKNKPSWAWISATKDRTTFSVDEEITFTMSADETNGPIIYYFIGINKGNNRIITDKCYGEYKVSFDEPGDYSVYVSGYNTDSGWVDSNIINFKIVSYDDLPGCPLEYQDIGTDFYALISQVSTKHLLTEQKDDVIFKEYSGQKDQYWFFSYNDNGSYTIESYDRTKALDVAGGSIENGTNVRLFEKNNSPAQQWYLYWADGGIYFKSALGNCVLDFNGASGNGVNADLWQFDGTVAQVMEFYSISLDGKMPIDMGEYFFAKIKNNYNGKVLSNVNNTNIIGENPEYKEEQTWCFIRTDNGSYKIMSYSDVDYSVNIDGFGNVNATNINLDTDNSNTAQRFFLYDIDGDIYIKPLCSDRVFDMNTDNSNMETWGYIKGAGSKQFTIEKVDEEKYVQLEIVSKPDKLVYNAGEKLNMEGLVIKQVYETGRSFTTSSGFTVDKSVLKSGDSKVTVTYEGKSTTFNITVNSLKGDINADGKFNISDAVILQKWLLGVPNTKLADWKAADLCEDDRLDAFDMIEMRKLLIENK